jgi:hypothetical protein
LWGSTPIRTFMGAHLHLGWISAIGVREGHSDFGLVLPHLFGATPHASGTGGTQA